MDTSRPDLSSAVAAVRDLFGAAAASCALVEDAGDRLTFVAASGAGADRILGVQLPVGRGIAGWVAMTDQAIAVRDVASDTRFARDVAEATEAEEGSEADEVEEIAVAEVEEEVGIRADGAKSSFGETNSF